MSYLMVSFNKKSITDGVDVVFLPTPNVILLSPSPEASCT